MVNELKAIPQRGELWEHASGAIFEVVCVDEQQVVHYRQVLDIPVWTTTLEEWQETREGKPRFKRVSSVPLYSSAWN